MRERTTIVVLHPRDRVWDALCERTCELARFLEHIEKAELKSREITSQGFVRCTHVWRAKANLPSILANHLDPSLLEWTGRTEWRPSEYESRWTVVPNWKKNKALCEGTMRFSPAIGGRATRVELDLATEGVQGPAGLQTITSAILSTHFRKLVGAAAQLIEQE